MIHYWIDPDQLVDLVFVHSRGFAEQFSKDADDSTKERSIYQHHLQIEKSELIEIIEVAAGITKFKPFGVGVELGAGCAAVSVELAKKYSSIEKIYAVEIVPEIVEYAAVGMIQLNDVVDRVIPVLGDFDSIKLESDSVDFIVEFDSLHHSFNLDRTVAESGRILKTGSQMLVIDRSHWNTSSRRRNELENQVYSNNWLAERGMDIDKKITRAENGEHEYLLSEYLAAFQKAHFSNVQWFFLLDPGFSILKLSLISSISSRLRKGTRYSYVHTWPLRKLIIPVILMKMFKFNQVGRFVNCPRELGSKRFQAKTVLLATK